MTERRPTTAPRAVLAATTSAAAAGLWLGLLLAVVTAARNDFHSLLDVLRLQLALGLVFAALAAAAGAGLGLLLAAALPRTRPRVGVLSFAVTVSTVAAVWCARAFEFRVAYPHTWEFVDGYAGMLAVAIAFLLAVLVGATGLAWGLVRVATAAATAGMTAGRASLAAVALAVLAAVVLAGRPDPESERAAAPAPPESSLGLADIVRPNERRVLLVGCDGATWEVVDPLLAEGELPNLRGLIERGVRAPLATLPDRPSPALWTSMASSRDPRDTGISDFYVQHVLGASTPVREFPRHFGLNAGLLLRDVLGRGLVKVTPVTSGLVRTRRLWQILADAGVSTGVVNWLVTWPAAADGAAFMVSERAWGALAPDRAAGTPLEELVQDAAEDGARLWDPPAAAAAFPAADEDWATEDAFVAATARRLLEEESPQVALVYFRDVDAAEHLAWDEWEPRWFPGGKDRTPHRGPVRESMLAFDRHLGTLLGAVDELTTVIVVSDHGHSAWFTWFGRGTPGGHTDAPDGLFLAAGPDIAASVPEDFRPSLHDVTPTVLRLVGLPAAADMEGDVLRDVLDDTATLPMVATWETGASLAGDALPSAEDEALLERLRALGYVR